MDIILCLSISIWSPYMSTIIFSLFHMESQVVYVYIHADYL